KATREIMALPDHANGYIADKAPWTLAQEEGREQEVLAVCPTALNVLRLLTPYLKPESPARAERAHQFRAVEPQTWAAAGTLQLGHPINKFTPLMARVDMAHIEAMLEASKDSTPAAAKNKEDNKTAGAAAQSEGHIDISDFSKVQLRVARVIEASHVEGADKLL